jgi:cytochrome c1
MRTTRGQDLARMTATLETWAAQIADLQAKARTAGAAQQLAMSGQLTALRQQRRDYEEQLANTAGASAAVFRDMLLAAERIAAEFRRLYVQASSRFAT